MNRTNLLERFPRAVLADALNLICLHMEDWEKIDQTRPVPVNQVLYNAWSKGRLADCMARLLKGTKPPPIYVQQVVHNGESFYIISDGNHRSAAAAEMKHTHIAAHISAKLPTHPERFRLASLRDIVQLQETTGKGWLNVRFPVEEDLEATLISLGVRVEE